MYIYKITNTINNKCYIGQTIRPIEKRWNDHIKDSKKVNYVLYRAMRKHGVDNFSIEQVDTAKTQEKLNKKEIEWIIKEQSMCYQKGYNMVVGDTRLNISKEILDKISKANIEAWKNPTYKQKMKQKMKKSSLKRYKRTFDVYEAIVKQKGGNQPYIYKLGKKIGTWGNQIHCANDLNLSKKSISACLRGKSKTHKGFIFKYKY